MLGLTGLVGHVWFGLVNGYHLKRPLVPLKEVIASRELNFGTNPGRVGLGQVGPDRSNSDNKAMLSPAGTGALQ